MISMYKTTFFEQFFIICSFLSERRGSNPRPTAWKAVALPTELLSLIIFWWGEKDSNLRRFLNGFTVRPIWPLWYLPLLL
jgi:hypothetical protein